jgi:hypothetical protein
MQTFYFEPIYQFFSLPPDAMLLRLLLLYGWIPFNFIFMWMLWIWYANELNGVWGAKQKYILLAIDIPKGNDQSPKAVENFFTYLAGAHSNLNLIDRYVDGKSQLYFSCEIVSIGGYTQFIIHTPADFRNLIEAGIYSQYPDAEITQIQDYTAGFPVVYPDDEYDVWGAEFVPTAKTDLLPIKTYEAFEHNYGKPEMQFRDPMSSLMDLCSSLRPGENLWYQILVRPTGIDWTKKGGPAIAAIFGEKAKGKVTILNKIIDGFADGLGYLIGIQFNPTVEAAKDATAKKMMDLKPEEKKQVEGIQEKIAKLGFECKQRMVYIARKDVMNKPKVVNGFVGYIKQFGLNDLNGIKPDTSVTGTSTAYFMKDSRVTSRKRKIVSAYMGRSMWRGRMPYILNVEELATLWHFPIESVVRAPLIQKTPGRKAEPPTALPLGQDFGSSSASFLDEIFVDENIAKMERPAAKQENIFDLELEGGEEAADQVVAAKPAPAASVMTDPFADIFADETPRPVVPSAPTVEPEAARGAPPANLPFA